MKLFCLSYAQVSGSLINALIADFFVNNLSHNQGSNDNIFFDKIIHTFNYILNLDRLDYPYPNKTVLDLFPFIIYSYENDDRLDILNDLDNNDHLIIPLVYYLLEHQNYQDIDIPKFIIHQPNLYDNLTEVDRLVKNRVTLSKAEKILSENYPQEKLYIYQALYNFFSHPYHIEISLKRSLYFSHQTKETAILTGYLLGLYRGYFNIPQSWLFFPELKDEIREIERLSNKLVAQWAGKIDNEKR